MNDTQTPVSDLTTFQTFILVVASIVLIVLLALSGIQPFDHTTWVLEAFPVAIALPVLWIACPVRFP